VPGHEPKRRLGAFNHATLFEFSFSSGAGTLSVTHDDGVSLFVDGGAGNDPIGNDLFNLADSAPTNAMTTETINLAAGVTYDLFYTSANGLPEILQTNFTPNVVGVPEIDASSGGVAIALLLGVLALVGERRRQQTA
jgi:hypothetical protein